MQFLTGLKHLQILNLSETHLDDAALRYLKSLPQLQDLRLGGSGGVTDVGIEHLAALKTTPTVGSLPPRR